MLNDKYSYIVVIAVLLVCAAIFLTLASGEWGYGASLMFSFLTVMAYRAYRDEYVGRE